MDWTIIQQALPAYGHGFVFTVWLSLVGIIGSIIVGAIARDTFGKKVDVTVRSMPKTTRVKKMLNGDFEAV